MKKKSGIGLLWFSLHHVDKEPQTISFYKHTGKGWILTVCVRKKKLINNNTFEGKDGWLASKEKK